ncbi:MAG: hypothetical protein M1839_009454 [Geoglossum umbratile]|nr:MAG: hypothetical protein M1839_009454 [Geoglossum umbratile]
MKRRKGRKEREEREERKERKEPLAGNPLRGLARKKMPLRLLNLPTEIQLSIAVQLCASKITVFEKWEDGVRPRHIVQPGHTSLLHLAQTCSQLHHLVMCPENDLLWKNTCLGYQIHPALQLDDVICAGTSYLETRLWRNVCRMTVHWSKPFPSHQKPPSLPRPERALARLPPRPFLSTKKRTIDLACVGYGDSRGAGYAIGEPRRSDEEGRVLLEIRGPKLVPQMTSTISTAILDPSAASSPIQAVESGMQNVSSAHMYNAYPHQSAAGFFTEMVGDNWIVSRTNISDPQKKCVWDIGPNVPDRMASNGDILVTMTCRKLPESHTAQQGQRPVQATNLLCIRAAKEKQDPAREDKSLLWGYDITQKWAEPESYTAHPVLRIFHLTKNYLVALTTRHNSSQLLKLTATRFLIIDINTGDTIRELTFPRNNPAAFTTAFDHNFILTDTHIISGGIGGELFVWAYNDPTTDRPIYQLPSPFSTKPPPSPVATRTRPPGDPVPRFYSNIAVSVCGRYVGATTSDQLWVFDMLEKRIEGGWNNGRIVPKNIEFARNPPDNFPGGVWVRWTEWEKGNGWERKKVKVAYLTHLDKEGETVQNLGWRVPRRIFVRRTRESTSKPSVLCAAAIGGVILAVAISLLLQFR